MVRIAHVIASSDQRDQRWHGSGDARLLACHAAIAGSPTHQHACVILGPTDFAERANELALPVARTLPPVCGRAITKTGALGTWLRDCGADIVQPWDPRADAVCRRASFPQPLIAAPTDDDPLPIIELPPLQADAAALTSAPLPLLTEPAAAGPARIASFANAVLTAATVPATVVLSAKATHADRAASLMIDSPHAYALWREWSALDAIRAKPMAALAVAHPGIDADRWATLVAIAAAHAHGVPVVATSEFIHPRLYPTDIAPLLTAATPDARGLIDRVRPLHEDSDLATRISNAVRAHAESSCTAGNFVGWLQSQWHNAIPATAGATR
ncbi:MAG: hypothetical protein AAF747_05765 [Planctomycetota bacterium]